jgi:hypothetical protein
MIHDRVVGLVARAGFTVIKLIFPLLPDWLCAKLMRLVRWEAYVITGNVDVVKAVTEVVEIFESGPPFTATVRKIVAGTEPEMVGSLIVSLTRKSPYGAV